MRLDKTFVLAKREYLARIKTKAFWISTAAVPLLFAGMAILPAIIMSATTTEHTLVLVDETGRLADPVAQRLESDPLGIGGSGPEAEAAAEDTDMEERAVRFDVEVVAPAADTEAQRAELERRVLAEEIDSWVWISDEGLGRDSVEYHAESLSNFITQEVLENALSKEVQRLRLAEAGIDADQVSELTRSIDLDTVRVAAEGSRAEAGFAGVALAYVLFFLLYMVIILYGQQVLNGVIEEKSSRAVEVLISSVRPFELMMGKLLGIGAVGLSQLVIWLLTLGALTAPAVVGAMAFIPPDFEMPQLGLALGVNFLVCFLLGYFIYASIYAAIGSAFNNLQEAQQFAGIAVIFLIAPLVLFVPVINDPNATWVAVASMVPLFTPLLMMLRVAVKMPPLWQLALGYGLSFLAVGAILWFAGRIYRVGILMYGKKPTLPEIWRWVRYS